MRNMPLLVGDPDKLTSYLSPVPGKPLTFRLTHLHPKQHAEGMELIPFFNLHESRYIVYWPQATEEEAEQIRLEQEKQEAEQLKPDAVTVDRVVCGEQQPESAKPGMIEDYRV